MSLNPYFGSLVCAARLSHDFADHVVQIPVLKEMVSSNLSRTPFGPADHHLDKSLLQVYARHYRTLPW